MSIHATAIVASGAVVPESCTIGPYCTVGAQVVLGEACELISHVVLDGHTTVGARNSISPFTCIGIAPQDLKYAGEDTQVVLGDDNAIREYVTISRGTVTGGGTTRVGNGCLIMAYAHIGHDSQVGSQCILANSATLAGHVLVEDFAVVGAFSAVHQFCRVGRHAYIGGGTIITQDVLPFSLTSAKREARAYGLNKIGLQRRGFTTDQLRALQRAYRVLIASRKNTGDALEHLRQQQQTDEVAYLMHFIEATARGIVK